MSEDAKTIDGYVVINTHKLGASRFNIGEKPGAELPYMTCESRTFGGIIAEHSNVMYYQSYGEAILNFALCLAQRSEELIEEQQSRNIPAQIFTAADFEPDGLKSDFAGRVVLIKPESLSPEYRSPDYMLVLVSHGNGARFGAMGRSVFGTELYSSESVRYDRSDIAGVLAEEKLPDWAKTKLEALREANAAKVTTEEVKAVENTAPELTAVPDKSGVPEVKSGAQEVKSNAPEVTHKRKTYSEEER
jgi:hypothetical protein